MTTESFFEKWREYIYFAIAFLVLALGIIVCAITLPIYDNIMRSKIKFDSSSDYYNRWLNSSGHEPLHLEIYMFNLTNPEVILQHSGPKLNVSEMGPYVFIENRTKTNLECCANGTLAFHNELNWEFQADLSNGALEDKLRQINPWYYKKLRDVDPGGRLDHGSLLAKISNQRFDQLLNAPANSNLFVDEPTVGEWLFEGFEHNLADVQFPKEFNIYEDPKYHKKFAFYLERNGPENADVYNIYRDKANVDYLGTLNQWNGQTEMPSCYGGRSCTSINGNLDDLWPPILFNKKLYIFDPNFCVLLALEPEVDEVTVKGVKGRVYTITPDEFTRCNNRIELKGFRNITHCKGGAPLFVSSPHFYLGDRYYKRKVRSLKPSDEEHKFRITLEPNTGTLLQLNAKLQINLYGGMSSTFYEGLNDSFNWDNVMIPMMWYHLNTTINDDYALELADLVRNHEESRENVQDICIYVGFPLIIVGATLVCLSLVFMARTSYLDPRPGIRHSGWTTLHAHH